MTHPEMSKRAEGAIKLLANGAEFAVRLETNTYTRCEKFAHRLVKNGYAIHGYGFKTFNELKNLGMLVTTNAGTSVSTYYKLNTAS